MKKGVLAAREEVAVNHIVAALERLGYHLEVVHERDKRVQAMKQLENVAEVLERMTLEPTATFDEFLAELKHVPGVGPATLAKIEEHFGGGSEHAD